MQPTKQPLQEERVNAFLSFLKKKRAITLDGPEYRYLREYHGLTRSQVDRAVDDLLKRRLVSIRYCGPALVVRIAEVTKADASR